MLFREVGFFQRNLSLKLLSFFLAVVLWLYVHSTDSINWVKPFEMDIKVPISYRGLPKDVFVVNGPSHIVITVRGVKSNMDSLIPSHFKATVAPLFTHLGTYKDVNVAVDKPEDVKIVKLFPEKVSFVLDNLPEKTAPTASGTSKQ